MEKIDLWKEYVIDFPIEGFPGQVAVDLGFDGNAYRDLLVSLWNMEGHFEFTPMFGSRTCFETDFRNQTVSISRDSDCVTVDLSSWIELLSAVDRIFVPFLPLGTVVELDRSMIPEDDLRTVDEAGLEPVVQIAGQKIFADDKFYIDYLAVLWPAGLNLNNVPLIVSNVMIGKIIQKGYEDEISKEYQDFVRERILKEGRESAFFVELSKVITSES